jgi:hypothetical protein
MTDTPTTPEPSTSDSADTPPTTDTGPASERWLCLGRRWSERDTRIYTLWRSLDDGRDRYYAKLPGTLGCQYEVSATPTGDTGTGRIVHGDARFLDRTTDTPPEQLGAWEVADRAAWAARRAHALEASAKRSSEVDTALAPLLGIAARLTTYADRAALAAYVTAKVHTAKKPH